MQRILAALVTFFVLNTSLAAATLSSDFSFGSGTPFGGTTTLGDVTVTLSSTETEPFSTGTFRDRLTDIDATVLFEFSKPVQDFSLTLIRVRADEFVKDFNIGDPDQITGTLDLTPNGISTLSAGDFNTGDLIWTGLNTTSISFSVATPNATALAFSEFSISAAAPVPLPASAAFLFAAIGLLGAIRARK